MSQKIDLHLGKVPKDPEARLQFIVTLLKKLTGRDLTPEEGDRDLMFAPLPGWEHKLRAAGAARGLAPGFR
jgi:hypothetical protein